jgi:predicted aspartyl protease
MLLAFEGIFMASSGCKRTVVCLLLLTCAVGCATPTLQPARTVLPNDAVTIDIALPGGFPAFPVDDKDPASPLLLLDTGAGGMIVTPEFAARHGATIRANSDLQVEDALGRRRTPRLARFKTLNLRGATFHDVDAIVDDLTSLREGMSDQVGALLGRSLLKDVLLTIDYPRRRIVIERGELPPVDGRDVLPINRALNGSILVPVNVGGAESWMLLDTGHTVQGLHLLPDRLLGLPWVAPPVAGPMVQTLFGQTASQLGRLDRDVQIGRHVIRRPIVCTVTSTGREYLGSDVLANFAITLDQKHDRIRFTRATERPIEVPPVRTLGFSLDRGQRVTNIIPDTAAERAGLRVGDHVTAIERVPVDQLRSDAKDVILRKPGPFRLTVQREGKSMDLAVVVTTLVE